MKPSEGNTQFKEKIRTDDWNKCLLVYTIIYCVSSNVYRLVYLAVCWGLLVLKICKGELNQMFVAHTQAIRLYTPESKNVGYFM